MKNLEIKARVRDVDALLKAVKRLGAKRTAQLHQIDTYFSVPKGRLKLRDEGKRGAYLIFYERGERKVERWSNYLTHQVQDTKSFIRLFEQCLGTRIIVNKRRVLYMYKNARIHLDTVKDLGTFMEIEVLVQKGETQAQRLMNELVKHLNIQKKDCIKQSYSDLLEATARK